MTQYHMWHPHFAKYCFKSVVIPLSGNFREYLLEDGVFQPEQDPEYEGQSEDSDNEEEQKKVDRKVDKQKLVEEAAILREKISAFIKNETS